MKKPFAGPQHVIQYLAHYAHRVAIANGRLLRFEDGAVTFRWRDSAHQNKQKALTLDALEFMRRFLLHVLPRGFVKIRHFGYLANNTRTSALRLCSAFLLQQAAAVASEPQARLPPPRLCPLCRHGTLVRVAHLSAISLGARHTTPAFDTS